VKEIMMVTKTVVPPSMAERQMGFVNITIHGHFYQPPREEPFLGVIPVEPGAAPFANYNEKICAECYRPNAEAGNFEYMSFNLGPTLASWLERAHPDVYQHIMEADRRQHNALAQAYNHTILPLMSERDKKTQVRWGIQDFCHRFGRAPQGMWVAETAIDLATLDVMAQLGIQFTILAPWQVNEPVDPTEPYRVRLREGRSLSVFIYNDLSGAVSYNDDATADANAFAASYQQTYLNKEKATAGRPQMHVIATDGELYGHHKPFRDKFLTHFLQRSAQAYGLEVCSLERYLVAHPATREVTMCEPSSWSCRHGVARWSSGCECDGTTTPEQRAWKPALRRALEQLQQEGDALFEDYSGIVLENPWEARDDYMALRNGWETPERFWERHARSSRCAIEQVQMAQNLLEAQYWLQAASTSCGFFFEDLDRIEPRNDIAFARRAISLIWQATGYDLQQGFLRSLQYSTSWRTGRTGAGIYHALPTVPRSLLPAE